MSNATQLINYWDLALSHPLGYYIRTPDTLRLKELLYNARAMAQKRGARQYDHLQIRTSPTEPKSVVWIVNPAPSLTDE